MSEPMMVDLWLGGEAADKLRAYSAATGRPAADVLVELATRLEVPNGHGARPVVACAGCGMPFYAVRSPQEGENLYCAKEECRRAGNRARQAAYRRRKG